MSRPRRRVLLRSGGGLAASPAARRATIRDVANAFLRVASDAELSANFPYDALGAARILLERATSLERGSNSRTRANSDFLR